MGNLPHAITSFVGRDREVARLSNLMGLSRLVIVTGPPGVGKTRLATEVASRLEDVYPDGAWLVELVGVGDGSALPHLVAATLGIHESPGIVGIADTVERYLRTRRLLLVIDNAEHVASACAEFAGRLVRTCADVSVLVTSRHTLSIPGERLFLTEPLEVPEFERSEEAVLSPSVRLFIERAREVQQSFPASSSETIGAVVEICRHLDGLPLAIELAAARIGTLSADEIAAHLDQRLDLFVREPNGDSRHHSLRVALQWSHDLLSEEEKPVFRRLSVFRGRFSAEAAAAVAAIDAPATMSALSGLVSKSLVVAETAGRVSRYRLLETIRAFAAEALEESSEAAQVADRHAAWCASIGERAEERLTGPDQLAALDEIDADYPDLRLALERAVNCGRHDIALRVAGGLGVYWRLRGRYSEGRHWLESALAHDVDVAPGIRAAALWSAGFQAVMTGDARAATDHLQESLRIARDIGDCRREARALLLLANQCSHSEIVRGLTLLESSYDTACLSGDTWCQAHALALIGGTRLRLGDSTLGERVLETAVKTARSAQDPQGLRIALLNLGELKAVQGRLDEGEALYQEVVDLARALREPYFLMVALENLASLAQLRGDRAGGTRLLEEAAVTSQDCGPRDRAHLILLLGCAALSREEPLRAQEYFRDAVDLLRNAGERLAEPLAMLAKSMIAVGDLEGARGVLEEASGFVQESSSPWESRQVLMARAELAHREGEFETAAGYFREGLQIEFEGGHLLQAALSLGNISNAALEVRRFSDAARLLSASEAILAGYGYVRTPTEQEWVGCKRRVLQRSLGAEKLRSLWAEGSSMSIDDAVSYALRHRGGRSRPEVGWPSLTKTEREIVSLVAGGLSNSQVGERLFVSPRTIANHLTRIYDKLDVSSRTQLVVAARRRYPEAASEKW